MSDRALDAAAGFAQRLADEAAAVTRRYFRTPVSVESKSDDSPVTIADREAEAAMRALIEAEYPSHGILGEEQSSTRLGADHIWVLDPIDGTSGFLAGVPLFGTLIALLREGVPVLGIIDQPILRERWLGLAGTPTTLNGKAVRTRACPGLSDAGLASTGSEYLRGQGDLESFERVRAASARYRNIPDCYGYAMLASGFVDLVIEAGLSTWDYCALVPVIEGAGGTITDWRGAPL
ncbi:MAG: histidinol-phosphatase, partial [Alphaproteobacteria bacterium]